MHTSRRCRRNPAARSRNDQRRDIGQIVAAVKGAAANALPGFRSMPDARIWAILIDKARGKGGHHLEGFGMLMVQYQGSTRCSLSRVVQDDQLLAKLGGEVGHGPASS